MKDGAYLQEKKPGSLDCCPSYSHRRLMWICDQLSQAVVVLKSTYSIHQQRIRIGTSQNKFSFLFVFFLCQGNGIRYKLLSQQKEKDIHLLASYPLILSPSDKFHTHPCLLQHFTSASGFVVSSLGFCYHFSFHHSTKFITGPLAKQIRQAD